MNNKDAVSAVLALKSAETFNSKLWLALGFLQFAQLPTERANANLRALQNKLRNRQQKEVS